jgi:hypothetical protein
MRRERNSMSTENGAPPDGGSAPTQDTTATVAVTPPAPAPEEFKLTKQEWLDFRREVRSKLDRTTPPADEGKAKATQPAAPAPVAADDTSARLDLADAMDDIGTTLSKENKALVKRLFKAERPTNVREWLSETMTILPKVAAPVVAAPTAPAPIAKSDTGAATAAPSAVQLSDNPLLWDAATVRKMGPVAWRKALEDHDARTGKGDPLHLLRPQRRPAK